MFCACDPTYSIGLTSTAEFDGLAFSAISDRSLLWVTSPWLRTAAVKLSLGKLSLGSMTLWKRVNATEHSMAVEVLNV